MKQLVAGLNFFLVLGVDVGIPGQVHPSWQLLSASAYTDFAGNVDSVSIATEPQVPADLRPPDDEGQCTAEMYAVEATAVVTVTKMVESSATGGISGGFGGGLGGGMGGSSFVSHDEYVRMRTSIRRCGDQMQEIVEVTDRDNSTFTLDTYTYSAPATPPPPISPDNVSASPVFALGVLGAFVCGFVVLGVWYWFCLGNREPSSSTDEITSSPSGISLESAPENSQNTSMWELNDAARQAGELGGNADPTNS